MKKLATLALITTLALTSFSANAEGLKVGTVDMNKIFSSYYKTKDAESKINEARSEAKKELDDKMDLHRKAAEDINKLQEELKSAALSESAKAEKGKQIDEKINRFREEERDLADFKNTREKQLQDQAVRMRNGIVEEITKLVNEKVQKDQYNVVLDRSGMSLNGVPSIIYADNTMDFSDEIIAQLNKSKDASSDKPADKADKKK